VAALAAEAAPAEPGRVVRVDAGRALVATAGGVLAFPPAVDATTGDWVTVAAGGIVDVLPRWSSLVRLGPDGHPQVLAADVDVVLVVSPLDRPSNPNRIERELVLAWDGGAIPVVVLTKADLVESTAVEQPRALGVEVVVTSAATGEGVDEIRARIRPDRTAALLGPSGAGKSALANAVLGHDEMATGEVRDGDHKGRHTTTSRHLLPVPGGGVLLDTPGLRGVALGEAGTGLALAFPDVEDLASGCRFRDCDHAGEPGCAVAGGVDPGRLASWQKLRREVVAEERRFDPRLRARHLREVKSVERSMRRHHGRG
jgi:ribosome biogenesis GTPase